MPKRLIIMRGLSGSGKSTLAKELAYEVYRYKPGRKRADRFVEILSTDDFFLELPQTGTTLPQVSIGGGGVRAYNFDASKLAEAHAWNQQRADEFMQGVGFDPNYPTIIVDNTNTMMWEAQPYVELARKYGYTVEFHEPTTPWARDPKVCAEKTKHGVPLEVIEAQLARWEQFEDDLDVLDTVLE